jgi:hypothetical protein
VDGSLSRTITIPAGAQTELAARVKMVELDNYWITARIESPSSGLKSWDGLYVSMNENGRISVGRSYPTKAVAQASQVDESQILPEYRRQDIGTLSSPPGMITIRGRFLYPDLEVGHDLPAKSVKVKIFDIEYWPIVGRRLQLLGENFTDQFGNFSFGPIPNDDSNTWDNGNGLDIVVYFVADGSKVNVMNANGETYEDNTRDYPDCSGDLDVGTWETTDPWHGGAWRLFAYVNEAYDFMENFPIEYIMNKIDVYYPMDDTYYSNSQIYVDPRWGRDVYSFVVQHEYGHFVMDRVYDWWLPQTEQYHTLWGSYSQSHAWAEGWADFFPLAVRNNPGSPYVNADFEVDPSWGHSGENIGDTVEGRVAGALWDLYDSQNDEDPNYDYISLGFGPIWNVFTSQVAYRKNNFSEFWNAWKQYYSGSAYNVHFAKMALYQNTIDYDTWTPTCTIGNLTGTWQISPVTLTAMVLELDWEDRPYTSVEFWYSRDNINWQLAGVDNTPTEEFIFPFTFLKYSIDWDAENLYDNTVWARARTRMDLINTKNKNNMRQDRR